VRKAQGKRALGSGAVLGVFLASSLVHASVTSDITLKGRILDFTQDWVTLEQEPGSQVRIPRRHFPEKADLRPGDAVHLKLSNAEFMKLHAVPVKEPRKALRTQKPKTGQP
jgi:RNase P/RNase MRP subunit p29